MKHFKVLALILMSVSLLTACGASVPAETEVSAETAPRLVKLILEREADRIFYVEGEEFDPAGLVLNAKMSDGTILENVPYTLEVDSPLTRTTLYATLHYEGKTVGQQLRVTLAGNGDEYSVENTLFVPGSSLEGKTIYWLGSSVTYGASACGESMADFIAKKDGAICIKEAISGTTLADVKADSYVFRFNKYLAAETQAEHLDAFVCQLSTNDRNMPESFGTITAEDVRDASAFDTATTFGAMEYIIASVRDIWGCPVFFFTNPPLDENYEQMVIGLEKIAQKWDVTIIDMYRDAEFNNLTQDMRMLYMADSIHPSRAGYLEWWLPKFEDALKNI